MSTNADQIALIPEVRTLILSANDLGGGAGIAAYRLHQGLRRQGCESRMLVQERMSGDPSVSVRSGKFARLAAFARPHLERLPLRLISRPKDTYHMQWLPTISKATQLQDGMSDVLNMHWVCDGFQSVGAIGAFRMPVVWTLHDMWAFTGGCHYAGTCKGYEKQCGQCPTLESNHPLDASRWVMDRKRRAWKDLDLTIVTPSRWLAEQARKSSLFEERPIHVIANGIDLDKFKPLNKAFCRDALGLPQLKKLVLFGAMSGSPRKGARHLKKALDMLRETGGDVELVVFGNAAQQDELQHIKTHYLGKISDEVMLALLYSAADVFVSPSEQDNLPNTMVESMACGTPCIAFDIGGMSDIVDHGVNGYLVPPFDAERLGHMIEKILEDDQCLAAMSNAARKKAETCFSAQGMAQNYLNLFKQVCT